MVHQHVLGRLSGAISEAAEQEMRSFVLVPQVPHPGGGDPRPRRRWGRWGWGRDRAEIASVIDRDNVVASSSKNEELDLDPAQVDKDQVDSPVNLS